MTVAFAPVGLNRPRRLIRSLDFRLVLLRFIPGKGSEAVSRLYFGFAFMTRSATVIALHPFTVPDVTR